MQGQLAFEYGYQGQRNPNWLAVSGSAIDSLNRESIAVRNRIRDQVQVLTIQSDVAICREAEFSQSLADEVNINRSLHVYFAVQALAT